MKAHLLGALIGLAISLAMPAFAQEAITPIAVLPKVFRVNQNTRSFTIQSFHHVVHPITGVGYNNWSVEETYKITDTTTFILAGKKASWADIRKGVEVKILAAHFWGSGRVADKVEIVSGS